MPVEGAEEIGQKDLRVAVRGRDGVPEDRDFQIVNKRDDGGGFAVAGACHHHGQGVGKRLLQQRGHPLALQDVGALCGGRQLAENDLKTAGHAFILPCRACLALYTCQLQQGLGALFYFSNYFEISGKNTQYGGDSYAPVSHLPSLLAQWRWSSTKGIGWATY